MSRKILLESLDDENRVQISKDLKIEIQQSKYTFNAEINPTYIYAVAVEKESVYVPFSYGSKYTTRPLRTEFTARNVVFEGELERNNNKFKKKRWFC